MKCAVCKLILLLKKNKKIRNENQKKYKTSLKRAFFFIMIKESHQQEEMKSISWGMEKGMKENEALKDLSSDWCVKSLYFLFVVTFKENIF